MVLCEKCQCIIRLSEPEYSLIIEDYLRVFNLKKEHLLLKKNVRALGVKNGISLNEIRRVLSLHLKEATGMTFVKISGIVGIEHSSVIKSFYTGKEFREIGDKRFLKYYNPLLRVVEKFKEKSLSNNFVNVE